MQPPRLSTNFLPALALSLGITACGGGQDSSGAPAAPTPAGGVPSGWSLVWADEFNVDGLPDPTKWQYDTARNRAGWYNDELQYYSGARLENSRVVDGKLIITARKERLTAQADYGGQDYSSARLLTRGLASWTYGFFEIRAKLPCGMGTWPAIWMLGARGAWPDDGEIDIMEQTGPAPGTVLGTAHMRDFHAGNGRGWSTRVASSCSAFHNYQVKWTADSLVWGVDGTNYFQYTKPANATYGAWPFDWPQFMILNVAVGGTLGGRPNDAVFPAQMEVEYVRVYQPR